VPPALRISVLTGASGGVDGEIICVPLLQPIGQRVNQQEADYDLVSTRWLP